MSSRYLLLVVGLAIGCVIMMCNASPRAPAQMQHVRDAVILYIHHTSPAAPRAVASLAAQPDLIRSSCQRPSCAHRPRCGSLYAREMAGRPKQIACQAVKGENSLLRGRQSFSPHQVRLRGGQSGQKAVSGCAKLGRLIPAAGGRKEVAMNIYVGNLSREVTEEDLRQAFQGFGQVLSASIIMDKFTREPRGFGFVEMAEKTEAQAAIAALNGKQLKGQALSVNEARPRPERREGRGERGGGRQRW